MRSSEAGNGPPGTRSGNVLCFNHWQRMMHACPDRESLHAHLRKKVGERDSEPGKAGCTSWVVRIQKIEELDRG